MRIIRRRMGTGFLLLLATLLLQVPQTQAAGTTRTVTTQSQLVSALNTKALDTIVIKPKRATSFRIGKKSYDKNLVVFQSNTTLINAGEFDRFDLIVTGPKQVTKAIATLQKYHRASENRFILRCTEYDVTLPDHDMSGVSLLIEKSNCDVTSQGTWKNIEIADMGTGTFREAGQDNSITVTGDVDTLVVENAARVQELKYQQKSASLDDTMYNTIQINGSVASIGIKSQLEFYFYGSGSEHLATLLHNESGSSRDIYISDTRYVLNPASVMTLHQEDEETFEEEESFEDEESFEEEEEDFSEDESVSDAYEEAQEEAASQTSPETTPPKVVDTRTYDAYTINLSDGTTSTVYGCFDETASYDVFLKVNVLRASLGLKELTWDTAMLPCAKTRSSELIQSYSHTRPDGSSCFTVLKAAGLSNRTGGENIAAGYRSATEVMNGWTNSSGHYANMTNKNVTRMTAGCIIARSDNDKQGYQYYWVQLFRD